MSNVLLQRGYPPTYMSALVNTGFAANRNDTTKTQSSIEPDTKTTLPIRIPTQHKLMNILRVIWLYVATISYLKCLLKYCNLPASTPYQNVRTYMLVPKFGIHPFSRFLNGKYTDSWFWGPIKHPISKQNAIFFVRHPKRKWHIVHMYTI